MKKYKFQSKKGAASIFVVIFVTMLLSVITLGFIRIMLSESQQTSNYDLSQSAYDSALAGIEDAKIALLLYHNCLSKGDTTSEACSAAVNAMRLVDADGDGLYTGVNDNDPGANCDVVKEMLRRPGEANTETIIQSEEGSLNSGGSQTGVALDQAYTCVTISEVNDNYISTLNENYRSKVIPLRTTNINNVGSIVFEWAYNDTPSSLVTLPNINALSDLNKVGFNDSNSGWFESLNKSETPPSNSPPAIVLQYIQANDSFTLSEFDMNNGDRTNRGTLILSPTRSGGAPTTTVPRIGNSANVGFAASSDKSINNPIPVNCDTERTFMCSIRIDLPDPYRGAGRDEGATFLRVSLPYGVPETDFSVTMYNRDGTIAQFSGVQAKIDSTGRTSDLFRRIEARVELVDIYFPFPEFAVTLGDGNSEFNKDFWVTRNNWFGSNSGSAY